ncbi:hypothetical protein EG19_08535 [Thermoanaerobaculum aquaticum]|uniref:DUF1015 domain-containing protein n=1 Tax=Thermoanaerobaculum aquaticum TaxID=1312852 RepID=A0A062XUB5_9BACT|nr:DUF1015 family protein [Thermoanaerobaculum aquaticum]KDA52944.1 hypothetical protein EG19_08535 [Thermoanaerobaculum aquaticum]
MSDVRPFRALRPRPELAAQVAAPPYDVVSSEEARKLAEGKPYSFLHINKPEIDLPPDVDLYDDRVYAQGASNLRKFMAEGVFFREQEPRFYVYQQKMGNHVQAGVVAAVSVAEYDAGLIKRHELTRKDKEDDRTRHVDELNANDEPVFLTYRQLAAIDALVDQVRAGAPLYDFVAEDGIGHTVWVVPSELAANLQQAFQQVPALYVADGHHRTAAAARVGRERKAKNPQHRGDEPYNYFMAVLFPHNQLQILDYNRVVKDLGGLSPEAFLSKVAEKFRVEKASSGRPEKRHQFGMYLQGQWYRLEAVPGSFREDDPIGSLDVSILQENLLAPVLGITDPRTDKRIDFIGGIRGLSALEQRVAEGWAVAFALYPTSLEQVMAVADAGLIMPPKSTWFEPKLRSGLLVRTLDTW